MTFETIALIIALIIGGAAICIMMLLLFSLAIETLEESETGRWILDRITKRKR